MFEGDIMIFIFFNDDIAGLLLGDVIGDYLLFDEGLYVLVEMSLFDSFGI